MPISYPLDTTGVNPTNLIADEIHTLTEINDFTQRIIIPTFAPFYLDNLVLKHVSPSNIITVLTKDVDYVVCLPYESASRSIGKMIYGGVSINTELLNGTIKITYQTLGGDWTADAQYVLEAIVESNYNPRITIWDIVTNKPNQFPPINHDNQIDTTYGYQELLDKFQELITTIANNPNSSTALIAHLTANNPHGIDKVMAGLGDVENYPIATDQEVMDKSLLNKYITLRQAVSFLLDNAALTDLINAHIANTSDPHDVTKAQVGLGDVVNYPIATAGQIDNLEIVNAYITLGQVIPLVYRIVREEISKNNVSAETVYLSSNNN